MKTGQRNRKFNNAGISLVELIVVLAIMSIVLGIMGVSISLLTGSAARGAYYKLDAMLNGAKTEAMSRYSETLTIAYLQKNEAEGVDSDGYYCKNSVSTFVRDATDNIVEEEIGVEYRKIGAGRVDIKLYLDDDTTGKTLKNANSADIDSFEISYNRRTGALNKVKIAAGGTDTEHTLNKLELKSGFKKYVIVFEEATGKHYRENS